MKNYSWQPTYKSFQGSLACYTKPLSFSAIQSTFSSYKTISDGYKVSTQWNFENSSGVVVCVYDYKETNLYYHDLPSISDFLISTEKEGYEWHVGSMKKEYASKFLDWFYSEIETRNDK